MFPHGHLIVINNQAARISTVAIWLKSVMVDFLEFN